MISENVYFFFGLIISFVLACYTYLEISAHYRDILVKSKSYWQEQQGRLGIELSEYNNQLNTYSLVKRNCLKAVNLTESEHEQLDRFLRSLNNYKYFMCLSTLYYSVKVENYMIYRDRELKNNEMKSLLDLEKQTKCTMPDQQVHLCLLNTNHHELCSILRGFDGSIACNYDRLNGHYIVELRNNFKLQFVLHEYKYDGLNKKAKLNSGLLGYLLEVDLDLPKFMFYNDVPLLSNKTEDHFFLNYANIKFRLPADIVNYFMLVYPDLWYL
jgi:hypothetical protein